MGEVPGQVTPIGTHSSPVSAKRAQNISPATATVTPASAVAPGRQVQRAEDQCATAKAGTGPNARHSSRSSSARIHSSMAAVGLVWSAFDPIISPHSYPAAALDGIALADGKLRSVDQTMGDTFASRKVPRDMAKVTLRQLLTMTSGLPSTLRVDVDVSKIPPDWVSFAASAARHLRSGICVHRCRSISDRRGGGDSDWRVTSGLCAAAALRPNGHPYEASFRAGVSTGKSSCLRRS